MAGVASGNCHSPWVSAWPTSVCQRFADYLRHLAGIAAPAAGPNVGDSRAGPFTQKRDRHLPIEPPRELATGAGTPDCA